MTGVSYFLTWRAAESGGIIAVSYTHLDVYKRQQVKGPKCHSAGVVTADDDNAYFRCLELWFLTSS